MGGVAAVMGEVCAAAGAVVRPEMNEALASTARQSEAGMRMIGPFLG
jgi:hypothetical protein